MNTGLIVGIIIYLVIGLLLALFGTGYALAGMKAESKDGKIEPVPLFLAVTIQIVVITLFYPLVIIFRIGHLAYEETHKKGKQ